MMLRRRANRLTSRYYAQSSPLSDPDIVWDSDNSLTRHKMINSPRFAKWYEYLSRVHKEEEIHENWKNITSKSQTIADSVYNVCGWRIRMFDDIVRYTYRPIIDETPVKDIKYKIKFEYLRSVRKWFISLGSTFLPDVIEFSQLRKIFKSGIYDPTNPRLMKVLSKIRKLIDAYTRKQRYIDDFLEFVDRNYPNVTVEFDKKMENATIVYKAESEDGWIPNQPKSSKKDSVTIWMNLDNNFVVIPETLEYAYCCRGNFRREYEENLRRKLQVFTQFPLREAFEDFMSD